MSTAFPWVNEKVISQNKWAFFALKSTLLNILLSFPSNEIENRKFCLQGIEQID